MADLKSQIQSIEEKLVGLGFLSAVRDPNLSDPAAIAAANDAFVDARDKAARFLAAVLDMDGVEGYSAPFGKQVLERVAALEKDGKLAEKIKDIKANADLQLADGAAPKLYTNAWEKTKQWPEDKLAQTILQEKLKDADIPKSQWGNIKLGGLLAFINDREQVVQSLDAIANDAGVQAVQQAQAAKAQSNIETVLKTIGQDGKDWTAPETQEALKAYVKKLQTDFGFPEDYRYGAFDEVTSKKLSEHLAAGTVPAGYDAAQLQAFIPALDSLRKSGAYKPPEKPLTAFEATKRVETILMKLVPDLNGQLKEKGAQRGQLIGQFEQWFGQFPDSVKQLLKSVTGSDILDFQIPEVGEVDGIFDMRAQASLQGAMLVLSHPELLGIPAQEGVGNHVYTVEKGKFIRENFEKKLKGKISDTELENLKKVLPDLLDSLDYLAKEGLISKELFINPDNSLLTMPELVQKQFVLRIEKYKDDNPGMLRLLDSLTRSYTNNMGMAELMPDLEIPDLFSKIDGNLSARDRLAQFYREAREKYGDRKDAFHDDMLVLINTVITVPFGDRNYRFGFEDAMIDAFKAAENESDPDKAAAMFAGKLSEAAVALHETQGGGAPGYVESYDREVPVWKPGLTSFTVTSGEHTYNATDIAQAYDNYNLALAQKDYKKRGMGNPAYAQSPMVFKDDNGQRYVAAIDAESMIFTIEKIDVAALRTLEKEMKDVKSGDDFVRRLRAADPGFALLVNQHGSIRNGSFSYGNLYDDVESGSVQGLGEMVEEYGGAARDIHNGNLSRFESNAKWNPALFTASEEAKAKSRQQVEFSRAASDLNGTPEDIQPVSDFIRRRIYGGPTVLNPQDRDIYEALSRNAEQELPWGKSLEGAQIRVKGIEVPDGQVSGPLMAYYDHDEQKVKVVEAPQILADPAQRKALMDSIAGKDDRAMMKEVTSKYPVLLKMMQNYSRVEIGRASYKTSDPSGSLGFRKDFSLFMKQIDKQMKYSVLRVGDSIQAAVSERYKADRRETRGVAGAVGALGARVKNGVVGAIKKLSETFHPSADGGESGSSKGNTQEEMRENAQDIGGGAPVEERSIPRDSQPTQQDMHPHN
ncbi:MAG: hypothetical protein H6861_07970 [Rhodospirillales bacterium]|nr:hypothetical protein [Rhodospirillales bacterium]